MNGGQERRHRREFEPPPWEQDAFERLQREREEWEKEAELNRALVEMRTEQIDASAQEGQTEPVAESTSWDSRPEEEKQHVVPAARLAELMAGLREEEPRVVQAYHGAANTVAALLAIMGVGFVVWAGILIGKAGPEAGALQMMASLLVMVWGFMMIAFSVVLWRKYNL